MTDMHFKLTDAKHQVDWILWLIARLDQPAHMGGRFDDLGPDDGSNPPTLEEFDCRTYPAGRPLTVRDVRQLGEAARQNIEWCLTHLGS
ncbi:MAG: hypothetical protein Q7V01_07440 [Vicinamibacterales bacterium]|nr:hypothetical protein [Vicinamibacterales bacterium]